jgi:hypothetical protein
MGNTPAQKRAKLARGIKPKKKRSVAGDPRTGDIMPKAGRVKITKADGTVEFQKSLTPTKVSNKLYAKARPKKIF